MLKKKQLNYFFVIKLRKVTQSHLSILSNPVIMIPKTPINAFIALLISVLTISCIDSKKEDDEEANNLKEIAAVDQTRKRPTRTCSTMDILKKHLTETPDLRTKMITIEKQCEAFIKSRKSGETKDLNTISIPIIVHVIYNNENENISDTQIKSQIDILNQDFTKTNLDRDQVPQEFLPLAANIQINFNLEKVIRVSSERTEWGTGDEMKFSSSGGSNVVTPQSHLNIWVCNIGEEALGYAQFPGDNPLTDGIVISPQYFGSEGYVLSPFDRGRTATHEVGHWLNLRHIWGDGRCMKDDYVDDTPSADQPNYGCPEYPVLSCNTNDMSMNYMDYVDDTCMYMFSKGQKDRMRAVFAEGGPRQSFIK